MVLLVKITKREARARYERGAPIAMAGEPWWFDRPREGSTFTRADFEGWADSSFDAIHTARGDARYSYAAPACAAHGCNAPTSTTPGDDCCDSHDWCPRCDRPVSWGDDETCNECGHMWGA